MSEETERPICQFCGLRPVERNGKWFRTKCWKCRRPESAKYSGRQYHYRHKLEERTICDRCGFIPEHICQLDVDHIDGDRGNNSDENLQILCANCHRLKTFIMKDTKQHKY